MPLPPSSRILTDSLRRALHVNLTPNFAKTYEPRQTQAGDQLLKDIMKDPTNYREHLRTFAVRCRSILFIGVQTADL